MTRDKLSEETIKRLPRPAVGNRVTYFAGATIQGAKAPRGFGVRVTAAGARAFILNYRLRGREYRYTIGAWPDWSALKAVREARRFLRQRVDRRGKDPSEDRAPSPATGKRRLRFFDDFVARHVRNKSQPLRSADEYESAFNRLVKPQIGKLSIYEVRRSHVNKMLDEIEDANGPVMADRTLAYLRKAFNWYAARGDSMCRSCAGWRGSSQRNVPARASCPMTKSASSGRSSAEAGTFGALVKKP